jgi:beta-galactosidase
MDTPPTLPPFPYGAVYFRKSNPPRADWARDYGTAAEDGMNAFRHWFLWGAVEVAPGVFDWEDYDRQLDLAAEHGLKTIIAEMVTSAPEWAWRRYAHARYEARDGRRAHSQMSGSCATGGFPGLCLDNEDAREAAGRFLTALATRYRSHPALGGYDIWNECNIPAAYCYCPATAARFREWLRAKYGDLKALGAAWRRYSFADWEDVQPPRDLVPHPDVLDWLRFRIDNAYRLMRWRADLIRSLDPDHPLTAHGVAHTLSNMADGACDEWRAASEVAVWGFTWIASRRGNEPWKHWHAVDLVRAGARGKPFWHAEAQAGPLWMQPQVLGRPREDGRIAAPEDIRLWNLTSFAGGATGHLYPRWRPLLDGPLFGAFGAYGMDGARTDRSAMTSRLARWATDPAQAGLWAARPVRGEVGILVAPESQLFCYAQQGSTELYAGSARGAYAGFLENNIQADFVRIEHIDEYRVLYVPFPVMLEASTAAALTRWVEAGGALVCEGCPAYFGDGGRAGERQPNLGLDALFGAREDYVEFTPDLLDGLTVAIDGLDVPAAGFLQAYEPVGGRAVGWYADGRAAVVDHEVGRGRTRLIGSFPGLGHLRRPGSASRRFFRDLLAWAGARPHVALAAPGVVARLHDGAGGTFLWVVNHNREAREVALEIAPAWGPFGGADLRWGEAAPVVAGRRVAVAVGGRDAAVMRLLPAP